MLILCYFFIRTKSGLLGQSIGLVDMLAILTAVFFSSITFLILGIENLKKCVSLAANSFSV